MAYGTQTPGQLFQAPSSTLESLSVDCYIAPAATALTPVYAWYLQSPKQLQIQRLTFACQDTLANIKAAGLAVTPNSLRLVVLQGQAGMIGQPLPFQLVPFNPTDSWDPMTAYGRKLLDLPLFFNSAAGLLNTLAPVSFDARSSTIVAPPGRGLTIAVQAALTLGTGTNPAYLLFSVNGDCVEREEQLSGSQIPMDQSPEIKESQHQIERLVQ